MAWIVVSIGHTMAMRRPSLHRAIVRLAAALSATVVLAACASTGASTSTQNAGRTRATGGARSVSTTTITSTVSPTSSASTAASGGGGPPLCRAAGLALRFLGQQGATGHGELGFALRNTGSASCRTFGFPGVEFLDASGGRLPTRSQRTTDDFFGHVPNIAIVLVPGASASFRLAVTHGNGAPAGCTTAHGLQVYPPQETVTLRATIPEGAAECGTATISPMRPGTSAYQ